MLNQNKSTIAVSILFGSACLFCAFAYVTTNTRTVVIERTIEIHSPPAAVVSLCRFA